MSVTKVQYGFTFNLGNYQSERIDAEVQPELGETPEEAFLRARAFVVAAHEQAEKARKWEYELDQQREQIRHNTYYIERYTKQLHENGEAPLVATEPVIPEGTDELEALKIQVHHGRVYYEALQQQLDTFLKRKREAGGDLPF